MKDTKMVRFNLTWILTTMLIITLTGCTDLAKEKEVTTEDKTSIKQVKQETQDLIQTIGAYTADQRQEAVEKTQLTLNDLDKRIKAMETRIDNNWEQMSKNAQEKARANLDALRMQRTEVGEWTSKMKNSSAAAWEHTKKGFSDAYKNLSDALEKSEKEFIENK